MQYPAGLMKKSRDASYANDARIPLKEYFESSIVISKTLRSIIKQRDIARFDTAFDMCSGCSFSGYYLLARNYAKYCVAVDKKFPLSSYRVGGYYNRVVGRMSFREEDIYLNDYDIPKNSVVLSIHPCKGLALRVVEIASENLTPLVIVPCCIGHSEDSWIDKFSDVGKYDRWCMKIASAMDKAGYDITIRHINSNVTPVNTIIIGV